MLHKYFIKHKKFSKVKHDSLSLKNYPRPRDAMHQRDICRQKVSVRLSVCLSVRPSVTMSSNSFTTWYPQQCGYLSLRLIEILTRSLLTGASSTGGYRSLNINSAIRLVRLKYDQKRGWRSVDLASRHLRSTAQRRRTFVLRPMDGRIERLAPVSQSVLEATRESSRYQIFFQP